MHCHFETCNERTTKPVHARAQDTVSFAVAVGEATTLGFKRSLHISGARHERGLQRGGDHIVHRTVRFSQRNAADMESLHTK